MVFSSPHQNPDLTEQVAALISNWKRKERRQHEKNAKKKKLTLEQYVESILLTQSNKTSSLQPKQPVTQTPKPKSHWREFENPNKWQKTLKNGRPLFDIRALKRPDTLIPPKTKMTYAMMDWFLRGVGHLDPKDFLDDPDGSIVRHPDLETYWKSEIYLDIAVQDFVKSKDTGDNSVYVWFSQLQHHITNPRMFWHLFRFFYERNPWALNREQIEKPERVSLGYEEIQKAIVSGPLGDEFQENKDLVTLEEYLDNYRKYGDAPIRVFRSFFVQKGKPIRKGITRLNEDGGIHAEGNGFSYTHSKAIAVLLRCMNTAIIKKYCKCNNQTAASILKSWRGSNPYSWDEHGLRDGWYSAIGEFEVKPKDIFYASDNHFEKEVVVNPKNVILRDYKFLNIIHYLSAQVLRQQYVIQANPDEKMHYSYVFNLDHLFDFIYHILRTQFKNNDELIGRILRSGWKEGLTLCLSLFNQGVEDELSGVTNGTKNPLFSLESDYGRRFCIVGFGENPSGLVEPKTKSNNRLYQPRVFEFEPVQLKH